MTATLGVEPSEETLPDVTGKRQEQIASLPELFSTPMTAGEIAKKVDYDEANTHTALNALEKSGLLEHVGSSPRRWRLARAHRRNRVLRASRMIEPGEWTTYGEIAIAVYGSTAMSRAVARVAAKHPAFANPERVIGKGGVIPEGWQGFGGGREECKRRLAERDGIRFIESPKDPELGVADPDRKISHEVITERMEERFQEAGEESEVE